ncbi:MAG: hypothetical protein IKE70_02935 [Bacilli bacterium]|nr:hypothetical protein [Bacilli bacterium]
MSNKYLLKPALGTIKEGFSLEDENGKTVYEGKMTKFKIFGASPFEFRNLITNKMEEHSIGKTVTIEHNNNGGLIDFLSKRSYFKFDGERIWDFLHDKGIRIDSTFSDNKIGMTYHVTFEGNNLANIQSSTPKGKSFITTDKYYEVTCLEKDLDLVFLVAFSIAKTDQTFYN